MGATTRFGLRFPELTDAPNGPAQMQTLAGDGRPGLDIRSVGLVCSSTAEQLIEPVAGEPCRCGDLSSA